MRYLHLILMLSVLVFSSCRNEPLRREYDEVVIHPPAAKMNVPSDHSSMGNLPEGHPPINNLPEGHPPIQGMDMSDPSMKAMIAKSAVNAPITWQTPEGWSELPGDGMRLGTLKSPDGLVQISISSFGGSAGGVEGNVIRWLGQLKITLDDQALKNFIDQSELVASSGGLKIQIFRFTSLNAGADSSMIAAMTDVSGSTVFLKMTGAPKNLEQYFLTFHEFCQSLELKS